MPVEFIAAGPPAPARNVTATKDDGVGSTGAVNDFDAGRKETIKDLAGLTLTRMPMVASRQLARP
jgi:hypothetical protein